MEIAGADARKITTVLRKRTGDEVEVIDSGARRFRASVRFDGRRVRAELRELLPDAKSSLPWRVTVAQAIPKGAKMDFVIEKTTELGVAEILPFSCERTIAEGSSAKVARWRRLATTAAQQCGRSTVPRIADPQAFEAIVAQFVRFDVVLFPWELSPLTPVREQLPQLVQRANSILAVVGPEGGFSGDEAVRAADAGAHLISLGNRILRTETAALVLLAFLNYLA
ncbi:MAG: 16S rRNA (uracil(1498)-N(3))-methyltransferase [Vulcanimicrobiaceae bacterium]